MILSTTDTIQGKTIVQHIGLVRGNTIMASHVGHDIMAKMKNLVGGEVTEYTLTWGEAGDAPATAAAGVPLAAEGETLEIAGGGDHVLSDAQPKFAAEGVILLRLLGHGFG